MVKLFGRGNEEKKEDEQFQKDLVAGEQHPPPGQILTEDYVNSLGRSVYMVMDPDVCRLVDEVIKVYPELAGIRIMISHLNRLTKINLKELKLAMLVLERDLLLVKMHCKESTYNAGLWLVLHALIDFCRKIQYDSVDGFKARIVTEQIKIVKAELEKIRKKVLPF